MKHPIQKISQMMTLMSFKNNKYTSAVILAAGNSTRMGELGKKQYLTVAGKPVIVHTLSAFEACNEINEIILVTDEEHLHDFDEDFKNRYQLTKLRKVVLGGVTRTDSALCGFEAVSDKANFVAIHDGARCLITPENITEIIKKAYKTGAAIAACPSTDTLKKVNEKGEITSTLNRNIIWRAQTPQIFSKKVYFIAAKKAQKKKYTFTDDSALVENAGFHVYVVESDMNNMKITTPQDLPIVESIFKKRGTAL